MLRKFASAAILEAQMGTDAGFSKSAHRAVFNYVPREGYLYVRSRAISSRCNDNFDMFPADEIEKSYLTFIGKPVFVNHHNEDHRRARGVIIDAALHKDRNPDGSPDTWAEVLMEVDAVRFPRLAKAILAGEVDRTSMGCDVQLSKCSVCGNEATSPLQYCAHIPGKKGKKIYKLDPYTGQKRAQLVFEICSGLSFFENSLLVEAPADPTAFFLGNVEVGPGLEHLTAGMNKTATRKIATEPLQGAAQHGVENDFVRSFEGRDVPDSGHPVSVYRDLSGAPKSGYPARGSWSIKRQRKNGSPDSHVVAHTVGLHVTNPQPRFYEAARQHFKDTATRGVHAFINGEVSHYAHPLEPGQKPEGEGWRQVSYYPDISHFFYTDTRHKFHGADEGAFRGGQFYVRGNHQEGDDGPVPQSKFEKPKTGKVWAMIHEAQALGDDLFDWDFVVTAARPTGKNPGDINYKATKPLSKMTNEEKDAHFKEVGRQAYLKARESGSIKTPNYRPEKKTSEMTDEEREHHFRQISHVQGIADNWMAAHPVKASNIVSSYRDASEDHKSMGRNWYPDANVFSHTAAHLINQHRDEHGMTPLSHTQVAGLIGVYSPQAEWHSNLHVALHAGRSGVGIGGGGERSKIPVTKERSTGSFTSKSQARQASEILSGMHYDDALASTSHKVRNFSHLIEHGGDDHHVVVDRHASSVAHGARLPDFVFDHGVMPKLSTKGGYEQYANAYRTATKTLKKKEPDLQPHMVQAATWLHQQKLNNADGRRGKNASAAFEKFKSYIGEFYPHDSEDLLRAPGTGHQKAAYGETKSPQDVDTLRSESCTVCGNSSAWDGTQCSVCGYVAPPRPFGDPNTDVAQQSDIRKQVLDGTQADPNDPNQQLGQQQGDPEEVQDQEEEAAAGQDPQLQTLTCNVCGTGIQPSAPTSDTGDEPPYPAEGDVCPVCKKGQLLGNEDVEPGMDSPDAEEGQEGDDNGASQQQLEEDDGDESEDEESKGKQDTSDDDDQDDGDSFDPNKKADKNSKTSSLWPTWFTPVWLRK